MFDFPKHQCTLLRIQKHLSWYILPQKTPRNTEGVTKKPRKKNTVTRKRIIIIAEWNLLASYQDYVPDSLLSLNTVIRV